MAQTTNATARQQLRNLLEELAHPNAHTSTETIDQIVYAIDHATDEQVTNFIEWFEESRGTDTMKKFIDGHYSYAENFGE